MAKDKGQKGRKGTDELSDDVSARRELARLEGGPEPVDESEIPTASGVKVHCAYKAIVDVVDVIPNPRNPNHHPARQLELLAKIIKSQGWRSPITISKRSGFVVRGHGRYEAAKIMQVTEVPVDYQHYSSDAEEWADLIADNRIAELAEFSIPELKEILKGIDTGEIDLDLTGFEHADIEKLMAWAPGDKDMPDDLPDPGVSGTDDSMGKLILVYQNETERQRWLELLGLKGRAEQVVFSLADLENPEGGAAEGGEG
ncbi:MAG: ParB/Srx family N-terminal domain-containing protein [Thermotogota bacterium]